MSSAAIIRRIEKETGVKVELIKAKGSWYAFPEGMWLDDHCLYCANLGQINENIIAGIIQDIEDARQGK